MNNVKMGIIFAVCIVGGILIFPVILPIVMMLGGMAQVRRNESKLQDPAVYKPVARVLAKYCQSDLHENDPPDRSWVAKEMSAFGNERMDLMIDPERAWLGMGGGFHHYGYRLDRDDHASSQDSNVWVLTFESEDSPDKALETFTLPKSERFTSEEIFQRTRSGFAAQIGNAPKDLSLRRESIQMLLRFDRVSDAREECKKLLKEMPDDWWVVLTNALILAQEQSFEQGEKLITDWVGRKENFDCCVDLAIFYQLSSKPRQAAAAIVKATNYDANFRWSEGEVNSECSGYTVAMYSYRAGDYAAVVRLCDHLLKVTVNGDYAKAGLRVLKAAAEEAQKGRVTEISWERKIGPYDPYEHVDIAKLLGRREMTKPE